MDTLTQAPTTSIVGMTEQLKLYEQQLEIQKFKLAHFRSWMQNLQSRFLNHVPQLMKNARRLYVGGLQQDVEEEELKNFLQDLMLKTGVLTKPGLAILLCKMAQEKTFAFVEFRSVEETSNMLALDGVKYLNNYLKIRRPSNYDSAASLILGPICPDPTIDTSTLDICRTVVEDTAQKLFIGGLPCDWSEDQVKALLAQFGGLKSFNLVMDKATGKSRGYAFCEFVEDNLTDQAILQMNGKRQGNKNLTVKRALEGPVRSSSKPSTSQSNSGGQTQKQAPLSGVPDSDSPNSFEQLSDVNRLQDQNPTSRAVGSQLSNPLENLSSNYGFDIYMKQQNEQLRQALGQQKQKQLEEIFRQGFIEGQNAQGGQSMRPREQLAQLGLNNDSLYGNGMNSQKNQGSESQNATQQKQLNQYLTNVVTGNDNSTETKVNSNKSSYNNNVKDAQLSNKEGKSSGTSNSNSVDNLSCMAIGNNNYLSTEIINGLNIHELQIMLGQNNLPNYNNFNRMSQVNNLERAQLFQQLMNAYGGLPLNDNQGCFDQSQANGLNTQIPYQCW